MIEPNQCTFSKKRVDICGITLATIWDVGARETYDISVEKWQHDSKALTKSSGEKTIVIRTLQGHGRIHTTSGDILEAKHDTLLLIPYSEITRYHCVGTQWRFWWFEVYSKTSLHIPERTVLPCPVTKNDISDFEDLVAHLRMDNPLYIRLAATKFLHMLHSWWARVSTNQVSTRGRERILKVITLMHEDLSRCMTIEQMAEAAGMSTTGFRKAFKLFTDQTPKAFYDDLRLRTARGILKQGIYNVSQTAAHTGFYDAYHFSKCYSKHFGIAPSQARKRT